MSNRPTYNKVLLVTGSLARGGAERQLYYLAQNLLKNGHQVAVATLNQNEYWEQPLQDLGIVVHCFEGTKSKWSRFQALRKIVAKMQPQCIYSFHFFTNTYAWFAGWGSKALVLGSIRNDGFFEKRMTGWMAYFHYYLPQKIVANSFHGSTNARKAFFIKRQVLLLPNAVDAQAFPYQFQPLVPQQPLRLLFVGRLEVQKRPDRLLHWFHKLLTTGIPAQLDLAGDGSLRTAMEHLADELKIASKVNFLGRVASPQNLMQKAHWLVLSSDYEGTPNVVLEAMSAGLPVITHPFEGANIILDGCGLVSDLEQFSSYELLSDNELRNNFSNAGRVRIERDYTLAAQKRNFLRLC